ncbi:MAG TPA: arginine--tRNA ligase [Candidatus Paceibacterota bacterium]
MKNLIKNAIDRAVSDTGCTESVSFVIERPADMSHGDYATNVAMVLGPKLKRSPVSVAIDIVEKLKAEISLEESELGRALQGAEVAGPGFINLKLRAEVHQREISEIVSKGGAYGSHRSLAGQKMAFEYTDPNPFKVFHIGHLMANTVGEALSRIAGKNGADIKRYCYQGDVGRHVALTIWGLRFLNQDLPNDDASVSEKVAYFGKSYALGATEYKRLEDEAKKNGEVDATDRPTSKAFLEADEEVQLINKKIYDRSDAEINELYDVGKEWSLEHFEELYAILDTKFDRYFFESQTAPIGIEIIKANTAPNGKGVFEESNGAVIFPGEKYGLHTRVFLTRNGLPGYEAKEIGLVKYKYEAEPYDRSIIVTANEQDGYFKVVMKAAEFIFPDIAAKNSHVSHGMLRLTTGKMSSRTGDVITGESLLASMTELSLEKMKEREISDEEKKSVAEAVAVAAIKYTILRQATGKDVIFDPEKSLSFEGDSGPYLQYSCVRAASLIEKARAANIPEYVFVPGAAAPSSASGTAVFSAQQDKLERLLGRFPEVTERAWTDMAPHHIANYLMELAGSFNSFYASTQVIKEGDAASAYKVALVRAFSIVMKSGLNVLGIKVPSKM